jgi:hypothetical protein
MSTVTRAGAVAVVAALALALALRWQATRASTSAGFWFAHDTFALITDDDARMGGPLTARDLLTIESVARGEVRRAFDGMRLDLVDDPGAFWRVEVVQDLPAPEGPWVGRPSGAAESYVLGPLGGRGSVSFLSVAQYAVRFAPAGATRDDIIAGIGRGIGRAAAHEFAHQIIVGSSHNPEDVASYEYPHADRAEQYYGELHWTTARDALLKRLGGPR